jgi:nucleoside-diphosphate-sugar epimerase
MRIVLTGATGFVGSHLLLHLAKSHEVFALTRSTPTARSKGVTWVQQDLAEPLSGLPEQVDAVVHLAQSKRYREFPEGAPDMFDINVQSTFRLLEYARAAEASSFVLASTGGVYGGGPEPFREDDPKRITGFYPASKWSGEALAAGYESALATVILRFFFAYGPGQTGMLVPNLIEKVRSGDELTVQGDEGLRINPIHVRDAIEVFEPAMSLGRSDIFNVAGEETVSIRGLIGVIEEALGVEAVIRRTEGEQEDLLGANKKMKDVLGVTPQVSLAEGIRSMVE